MGKFKVGDLVWWGSERAALGQLLGDRPQLGIVVKELSLSQYGVQWLTDSNTVREHYAHELVKVEVEGE